MAVNPVQFLVASNASITDGSKVVNISGNVDCSRVFSGTAVFLGGADNPTEAVSGTSPDGNGNSTITLRNNWSQGDVVNQQMVTFNTNEGLAEAISNVREIVSNVSAIEDLATQGLIKRIDDNTYEVVNISTIGESLITANDASSQRSVIGLGNAATKDVGTAAGNVMEVGAFGVGSVTLSTQLDLDAGDYIEAGMTIVSAPVADLVNGPVDSAGSSRYIVSFAGNLGTGVQTVTNRVSGKSWFRVFSSGVILTDWQELYHSGNTNFNEFGGLAVGDEISLGVALSSTVIRFPLYVNSRASPTSITVVGTFEVKNAQSVTETSGLTASDVNLIGISTSRVAWVDVEDTLASYTPREMYRFKTESSTSKITVNF